MGHTHTHGCERACVCVCVISPFFFFLFSGGLRRPFTHNTISSGANSSGNNVVLCQSKSSVESFGAMVLSLSLSFLLCVCVYVMMMMMMHDLGLLGE